MVENLNNFITDIEHLKRVDRAGWVQRGIQQPESVAEHSFGTGWLSFALAPSLGLDAEHCAMLGFVHDMAETRVGDFTPSDHIDPEEKFRLEEEAMISIAGQISNGDHLLKLWYEVEREETPEGKFVRRMDKLEMMFQAYFYGVEQPDVDIQEFWDYADRLDFKDAAEIYRNLRDKRDKK